MNKFREYIEKRQAELGLSGNQLAKNAGLSSAWHSRFMSGERKEIQLHTLISLSKALQISESKLIAAYKGEDPDQVQEDYSARTLNEMIQVLLKNIPHRVFAEALIQHDGVDKVRDLLKEALDRQKREQNAI